MTDTIAAIATPLGAGGIGIIRISGPLAHTVLSRLAPSSDRFKKSFVPWQLHRVHVVSRAGTVLDDALVVFMPGPKTFTGEDVVELHCHGSPALLSTVLEEILRMDDGIRLASRGEFTRRAFMNGRMDLAQAEAVAELIAAPSREGVQMAATRLRGMLGIRIEALRSQLEHVRAHMCLAVDFPEEEVEAFDVAAMDLALHDLELALEQLLASFSRTRCWREGMRIALAGPVNAGKSSLMNALLGRERALVTPIAGTTRDFLEESVSFDGLMARLVDTAGLRETEDVVESAGIRLGQEQVEQADVVLLLIDGEDFPNQPHMPESIAENVQQWGIERTVLVWNKADLHRPEKTPFLPNIAASQVVVSAHTGEGLEDIGHAVRRIALSNAQEVVHDEAVPNLRQAHQLEKAKVAIQCLRQDMAKNVPFDVCAVSLESAAQALGEVVGLDTTDDILNRIFETFCIGK